MSGSKYMSLALQRCGVGAAPARRRRLPPSASGIHRTDASASIGRMLKRILFAASNDTRFIPGCGSRLKILELASKKQMLAYLLVGILRMGILRMGILRMGILRMGILRMGILRMGILRMHGKMHDSHLFVPGCGSPGSYYSPSVATMMALMVCRRFSASSKTIEASDSKTSSVTSMLSSPNFS